MGVLAMMNLLTWSNVSIVFSVVCLLFAYRFRRYAIKRLEEMRQIRDIEIAEAKALTRKVEAVLKGLQDKRNGGNYVIDSGRVIDDINKALRPAPGTRISEVKERR